MVVGAMAEPMLASELRWLPSPLRGRIEDGIEAEGGV
jgi:hypothetical protein